MLIQKLTVFLGGPVYSMSVTMFSLLVFSGLGSFMAKRFAPRNLRRNGVVTVLSVAGILVATTWFVNEIVPTLMALPHWFRCVVAILTLLPVGFLMGMPSPTGIRVAERLNPVFVPWAWCVNACATVLGSIASIIVAMFAGFTVVLHCAIVMYVGAALALLASPWLASTGAERSEVHATGSQ